MAKNHLLEAAAEILKASQASAGADAAKKLAGEVEDLGGSTIDNPSGNKIDAAKNIGKITAPGKPAPVGQMPTEKITKSLGELAEDKKEDEDEEEEDEKEEDKEEDKKEDEDEEEDKFKNLKEQITADFRKAIKEDIAAILKEESGISSEFREKLATIYEARILDKISSIEESILSAYNDLFNKEILALQEAADSKIDDYLEYVVEGWLKDNEVAIESGLKTELTEDFITGLHTLFAEHYITVPEDKVNVIDELAEKVQTLETSLNEQIQRGIELKKELTESKKQELVRTVCEGLTQTQTEKVRTLAESVDYTADGDFVGKIKTIRENFFGSSASKATEQSVKLLTEGTETETADVKQPSPAMSQYVKALTRATPAV